MSDVDAERDEQPTANELRALADNQPKVFLKKWARWERGWWSGNEASEFNLRRERIIDARALPTSPAQPSPQSQVAPGPFRPEVITLGDLLAAETTPPEWIIEGLLPPGLTIIGGRPKVGKSRIAIQLAEAVTQGRDFFGHPCRHGTAIYLDLENAKWRISKRWRDAEYSRAAPEALRFVLKWRRGNREALLELMDRTPELRVVVVDVWVKFRAPSDPRQQAYDQDYAEIGWLQEAAIQRGIAIVLVHHLRKALDLDAPFESLLGSVAVFGGVDNAMLLLKHEDSFRLVMQGRDIEDATLALASRGLIFECLGTIDPAAARVTPTQRRYLDAISTAPLTGAEVARALGVKPPSAGEIFDKLQRMGLARFVPQLGWKITDAGRSALL